MKWPCLAVGVWLTACISGGQDPLDAARTDATAGPMQPDVGPGTPDALAPTRTDTSMAGPDAGLVDDASARDAAPDQDGDGISDAVDNCPAAPNPLQRDADADADGIGDACDVCPARPDASQADADADGIGDACEIPNDDDSDGVPDARDSCPHRANGDQADADMDDVGDVCDDCPEVSDPAQEDADGDGMGDAYDACPAEAAVAENHTDRDGDGFPTCAGDCDDTNPARSAGLPERCDGIDNDCDGGDDDTFPELGGPCSAGLGECRREGVVVCGGDLVPACDAVSAAAADEVCDALDNDCDGEADEGLVGCCEPGVSEACGLDVGACVPGERVCQDNRIWSACDGVGPTLEACNAQDDDCDDRTDEGLGVRPCGVGACEHLVEACMAGVGDACDPFAGAAPERCQTWRPSFVTGASSSPNSASVMKSTTACSAIGSRRRPG